MKKLLIAFVLLIVVAYLVEQADQDVRTLLFCLLFGAMVGAMCSFSAAWRLGAQAERNAQRQIKDWRNGVGTVRPYIEVE